MVMECFACLIIGMSLEGLIVSQRVLCIALHFDVDFDLVSLNLFLLYLYICIIVCVLFIVRWKNDCI